MSMVHLSDRWRSAIRRKSRSLRRWIESRAGCCECAQESWTVQWSRGKKKQYKFCSVSYTDRSFRVFRPRCIVTSRRFILVLSVYVFLSLKAVSPIDCHYMTDRLQRIEFKIFVCVLLKKQSHLHPACPGGKQINITFTFLGELSL